MTKQPITSSSASAEWCTPLWIFERLSMEFGPFTLDAAARHDNALCEHYYTPERGEDGLCLPWTGRVWCNPPYGRGTTGRWLRKAMLATTDTAKRPGEVGDPMPEVVVMLVPNKPGTGWWMDFVRPWVSEIRDVVGRIQFDGKTHDGQARGATFDSAIVVYRPRVQGVMRWSPARSSMSGKRKG